MAASPEHLTLPCTCLTRNLGASLSSHRRGDGRRRREPQGSPAVDRRNSVAALFASGGEGKRERNPVQSFTSKELKNIGLLRETGTLPSFIMLSSSASGEIVLYPLKMLVEIVFLILRTLPMNLFTISKIFSTP
jgi:hypothetical protein